jgi:hypothetical protein
MPFLLRLLPSLRLFFLSFAVSKLFYSLSLLFLCRVLLLLPPPLPPPFFLQDQYGYGKYTSEKTATDFCKENGIEFVSINPTFIIGPPLSLEQKDNIGVAVSKETMSTTVASSSFSPSSFFSIFSFFPSSPSLQSLTDDQEDDARQAPCCP